MCSVASTKLIIFDCDSTLSAIEGVDELARLRGPEVFAASEAMTHDAMEGKIAVEEVFGRRLNIIRPGRADVAVIGRLYVDRIEPTALTTIGELKAAGWTPVILSGGFRQVIEPLAAILGIDRIEAVDLYFDGNGDYKGYDEQFPTTRSGGKPLAVAGLKREYAPARTVMIGDGASDLETKGTVDLFVGFGRYTERPKVKAGAHAYLYSLSGLTALLQ